MKVALMASQNQLEIPHCSSIFGVPVHLKGLTIHFIVKIPL